MTQSKKVLLTDANGKALAELLISDEDEGWFTGRVVWQNFPAEVKKVLGWYGEVVHDQMLSYLDDAAAAVQRLDLQTKFSEDSSYKTYSLHLGPSSEVSFRISPVLPPPDLPMEAIR
jgi:hypothetical protein